MEGKGMGLPCPECNGRTRTLETRIARGNVRRRRVCKECSIRFTSWELDDTSILKMREQINSLLIENGKLRFRAEACA